MDLALYHSDGYYAGRQRIGAAGDYYTSPVAHPAFGALTATQLEMMWVTLGRPSPFWVVEAGAGDGVLARDITSFCAEQLGDFSGALRYICIDRATPAVETMSDGRLSWVRGAGIPLRGIVGCVLSNELLDAFAVHRFRVVEGEPREIYVTRASDGSLVERLGEPSDPVIADRLSSLGRPLRDGFEGEVNGRLGAWARDVASALVRGYTLTIDYGYEADELYSDIRSLGTLQTYYRHTDGGSPYQRIGRQDMTAHVDFSALIDEGRKAGLRPVFLTTQSEFLGSLGLAQMEEDIRRSDLDARAKWANIRAIRELARPDGLGKFRVLVQEKGTGIRESAALIPSAAGLSDLRAPLLTDDHLSPPSRDATGTRSDLRDLWPPGARGCL